MFHYRNKPVSCVHIHTQVQLLMARPALAQAMAPSSWTTLDVLAEKSGCMTVILLLHTTVTELLLWFVPVSCEIVQC